MTNYYLNDTAVINLEVSANDVYVDPNSVVISIILPDRSYGVTDQAMLNDSVGFYHYNYKIADISSGQKGTYKYIITGTSASGLTKVSEGTFNVI